MAQIVLGAGASHGAQSHIRADQWPIWGAKDETDPRFDFAALLERARPDMDREITPEKMQERYEANRRAQHRLNDVIASVAPDVVVIVGDDQHEQFLDDNMPMFCLYRGASASATKGAREANAPPDVLAARAAEEAKWSGAEDFQTAPELADHLIRYLINAGFDLACSSRLKPEVGLGHAFRNVCRNMPQLSTIRMLPLMVNTFFPPNQPPPGRAYALGQALRAGIAAWDSDQRVAVMASGGLSHQILEEELDRELLGGLQTNDADRLRCLPQAKLQLGTSEILNWVVAGGAVAGMDMTLVDYIPAYRSRGGTGTGLAYAFWTPPKHD